MILRIDHIGLVARSLEEASDLLIDTLGFEFDHTRIADPAGYDMAMENAEIHFIRVGQGDTMIELLLPRDTVTGMGKWLDKRGPSVHHVAYMVDDVDEHAAELVAKGLEQIDMGPDAGAAFFYPRTTMGILTELVDAGTMRRLHDSTAPDQAFDPGPPNGSAQQRQQEQQQQQQEQQQAAPVAHRHGTGPGHTHVHGGVDHRHF